GIRDRNVTGVQTCALPIYRPEGPPGGRITSFENDGRRSQTLLENWRRGPSGGRVSFCDPHLGEPRPCASTTHGQQVPALLSRRCQATQAGPLSPQSSRFECS